MRGLSVFLCYAVSMNSRFELIDPDKFRLPEDLARVMQTPALIIHLPSVRENLRRMTHYLGGTVGRWRPHIKTVKIPQVMREMASAGVRYFKCATTREAIVLLETMGDNESRGVDLLIAYPHVMPALDQIASIAGEYPTASISVICEDLDGVRAIPPGLGIYIDINPGMNRTGISRERQADIPAIAIEAGERFHGLHYYEGQILEIDRKARRARAFKGYDDLMGIIDQLMIKDIPPVEIITSGTPVFLDALAYKPFADLPGEMVHRVSPGTVVFHDLRSEETIPDLDLVPAAVMASRVISCPEPGIVTMDCGSKSIAAEAGHPCAFVVGRPELVPAVPSEEHLPTMVTRGEDPRRGEMFFLVPRHVCPTINLADKAVLIEEDGSWEVVPVRARGHELIRVSGTGSRHPARSVFDPPISR